MKRYNILLNITMMALREHTFKYEVTQADVDRMKSPEGDSSSSITKNSVTTAWKEANNFIVVFEVCINCNKNIPVI